MRICAAGILICKFAGFTKLIGVVCQWFWGCVRFLVACRVI
jgi:hypothetical protein